MPQTQILMLQPDVFCEHIQCSKMQLRPGLCPVPLWGSLQRSPDTLAAFKGRDGPVVGKGKEMRKGKEQKSRGGEVRGVGTGPPIG